MCVNILKRFLAVLAVALMTFQAVSFISPQKAETTTEQFPQFSYNPTGAITPRSTSPTNEWIFPTIIKASDHIANPIKPYYLYAAPHDEPGGIYLFVADSPDGPWTKHSNQPVIGRYNPPHYSVLHVSSPHVIWVEEEQKFFMYYHGDNDKTRYSTSADGVNWSYGGIAIDAVQQKVTATSYARVFRYTIPRLGNKFVMLYHDDYPYTDPARHIIRIKYATSNDARNWTVQPDALVSPSGIEGRRLSSPTYFPWNGKHYIVYHAASGNIHITEVGANFDLENHLGIFYDSSTIAPESNRAAAPTFFVENGYMHMYYESGPRSNPADFNGPKQTIWHTKTLLTNTAPLSQLHSGTFATGYFNDVYPSSHHDDIYKLERAGFTTGYGSRVIFNPWGNLTRAEIATFIARAAKLPPRPNNYSSFNDVPVNTYYTGAVEAIRAAGISGGCGNNNFCPNRLVTRQEMAVFLQRALGLPLASGHHFVDVPHGTSFTGSIYAIYYAGITNGCNGAGSNVYCPTELVTRQQMASFLVRAFNL